MRCCDRHLPALVEWPEGKGVEECPLCAAKQEIAVLESSLEILRERLEALRMQVWVEHVRPGGQA